MKKKINISRLANAMLGLGVVLFPVHNKAQPLFEYGVFLPHIAVALMVLGVMWTIRE